MDTIDTQYHWQPFTCRIVNILQGKLKEVHGFVKTDYVGLWYSKTYNDFDDLRDPELTGHNLVFYIYPRVAKIIFVIQGVTVCSFPFTEGQDVLETVKALIDYDVPRDYLRKKIRALFTYEACHDKFFPVFNTFYPLVEPIRQYNLF